METFMELPDSSSAQQVPAPNPRSQTMAPPPTAPPSSEATLNEEVMKRVFASLIEDISKCSTVGGLARLVPVPAQPGSKTIFEDVFTACQKKGSAEILLKEWRKKLADSAFDKVSMLNSIKAPVVQVCKEAQGPGDGGLSGMNFSSVIKDAKMAALQQMIAIKEKEFNNLVAFSSRMVVERKLAACWEEVVQGPHLTPEHRVILQHEEVVKRMAHTAAAIGASAYLKVANQRQRQQDTSKEAKSSATDLPSGAGQKSMMSLIEEAFNRREQSRRDKNKAKKSRSGNGKRGAGPPRKQNQKKEKKTGGVKPIRERKGGRPTKKQLKRR